MPTTHATCVSVNGTGVLIRGEAGAGKSKLAHRLILHGHLYGLEVRLVADDRVALKAENGTLTACAPEPIRGLLEVRGLGLIRLPFVTGVPIGLVIDLMPEAGIPRMPDPEQVITRLEGVTLPRGFASGPENGLDLILTMAGQAGAELPPDLAFESVRFDGKTKRL